MWSAGEPVRKIGAIVGRNPGWVSVRASRLGLPPRSPRVSLDEKAEWSAAYLGGVTIAELSRRSNRYSATVRKALVEDGIDIIDGATRARRWPVQHDAFAPPLSAEGWYWIGFLAADGYVRRSHLSLGLKPSSAPVLHRFLEFVGSPGRPLIKTAAAKQLTAVVNSPRITADVGQHGVLPGKTLSLAISRETASEPASGSAI